MDAPLPNAVQSALVTAERTTCSLYFKSFVGKSAFVDDKDVVAAVQRLVPLEDWPLAFSRCVKREASTPLVLLQQGGLVPDASARLAVLSAFLASCVSPDCTVSALEDAEEGASPELEAALAALHPNHLGAVAREAFYLRQYAAFDLLKAVADGLDSPHQSELDILQAVHLCTGEPSVANVGLLSRRLEASLADASLGDLLVDASTFLWVAVLSTLLPDMMIGQAHDAAAKRTVLHAVRTVHGVLLEYDADDVVLRAKVALWLSVVFSTWNDDCRRALQVLCAELARINAVRDEFVDPRVHNPFEKSDVEALAHASFTTALEDDQAARFSQGRLGAFGYAGQGVFGAGCQLDAAHEELHCFHADIVSTRFSLELALSRADAGGGGNVAATARNNDTVHNLASECRQNLYSRALLALHRTGSRGGKHNVASLRETSECLVAAQARERELLQDMATWGAAAASTTRPKVLSRGASLITIQSRPFRAKDHVDHVKVYVTAPLSRS